MFHGFGRATGGLAVGVALALGASAPVLAAPGGGSGSGASVSNTPYHCDVDPESGGISCGSAHEVTNLVITPSENVVFVDNGSFTSASYDANGQFTGGGQGRGQSQTVYKNDGTVQVDHTAYKDTVYFADGTSCTITLLYRYANGRVVVDRTGGTCPPPE